MQFNSLICLLLTLLLVYGIFSEVPCFIDGPVERRYGSDHGEGFYLVPAITSSVGIEHLLDQKAGMPPFLDLCPALDRQAQI